MIIEQLTNIYENKENWHVNRLNHDDANEYHERLLVNGNILTYIIKDELIGYLEFWRLDFEQLGRLLCGDSILTDKEDLLNGKVAYINNMWINYEYRNGLAFNILASMFLSRNKDAEYFIAFRNLKHNKPIQVYKREDLIKFYTKGI